MGHMSWMLNGIKRSLSINGSQKKIPGSSDGSEAVESMAKDARRNGLILKTSGMKNSVSVYSRRGEKGVNQDCCVVWEDFGCQEDMIFCGVFDGHGPWGHFVAKCVRRSMPRTLLRHWQESLVAAASLNPGCDLESDDGKMIFNVWKHSFIKACAAVDKELVQNRKIDSFYSGTTALAAVRQGDKVFLANVGDSRAVLATTSDDGNLMAVQLTVDFKPNLPHEADRIFGCKGRVFCLMDEPGVHRVWLPDEEKPGLAMSRAFGDYCLKEFGLISLPEVPHIDVTCKDEFIILATDGVWDVISNEEAVSIVSAATDRGKAAKRLVEGAAKAWKRKRTGIAMDDISAVVLFFHASSSSSPRNQYSIPK